MFKFEYIEHLYLLFAVIIFVALYIFVRISRTRKLKKYGNISLVSQLASETSIAKRNIKFIIISLAFAIIIFGLANPQLGTKLVEAKREGIDLMIALDLSNSMKAEDIAPSRLERAKLSISNLIDNLQGDRIGLIVFAGDAYLQLPMTADYSAAKLFLSSIDYDIMPVQGTAIGKAIDLATESLSKEENAKKKALIIITDGENHDDYPVESASVASKKNIIIHTIGFGSLEGAPIPIYTNGIKSGFLKDNNGTVILSKADAATLEKIATVANGKFIMSTDGEPNLTGLLNDISKMEKTEFETKMYADYESYFQYFFATALFLLIIDLFISEKKSKFLSKFNLYGDKNA
ncbi:MAG TPA: VWA domain-containing protein [Candidatus Kapabacteria bacterium]|nr:VWA domain-containing protein [Candidatus Kapabacteria bacterium]